MTGKMDMEQQASACRNIDEEGADGQYLDQCAGLGINGDCRDVCDDEDMEESPVCEHGQEEVGGFPDGRDFLAEEDGIGVVEILLILVVLITLVIIFRERLTELLSTIFESINSKSATVMQ